MVGRRTLLSAMSAIAAAAWLTGSRARAAGAYRVTHTDAEWRRMLTQAQYQVLRQQATEYPNTSPLAHETRLGIYGCGGCTQPAFDAATKFDSHTGWPSFWEPLPNAVAQSRDASTGFPRTEIHCTNCGGHLGHVFSDGPKPTGLRYCMNGVALAFHPVTA